MGFVVAHHPSRRGPTALYAISALVVFAAVLAVAQGTHRSVQLTVNGEAVEVERGTTVRDLIDQGMLKPVSGNVRSVSGKVVRRNGGHDAVLLRNGSPVDPDQLIYRGDVIASKRGADATESVVTKRVKIDASTKVTGRGPVEVVVRKGRDGVREIKVGAISGSVVTSSVVTSPISEVIERRRISKKDKVVALTFDDGPWPGSTNSILNILKKEKVHATFFMLGARARVSPSMARRIEQEGHSIGNHSLSHVYLNSRVKPGVVKTQISGGQRYIKQATGVLPKWYRPAGGVMTPAARTQIRSAHLTIVMWDVDSRDWTRPGVKPIVRNVVSHVKPGSIVLMHDGGGRRNQTVSALGPIIHQLKKKGYRFVTLDELTAR